MPAAEPADRDGFAAACPRGTRDRRVGRRGNTRRRRRRHRRQPYRPPCRGTQLGIAEANRDVAGRAPPARVRGGTRRARRAHHEVRRRASEVVRAPGKRRTATGIAIVAVVAGAARTAIATTRVARKINRRRRGVVGSDCGDGGATERRRRGQHLVVVVSRNKSRHPEVAVGGVADGTADGLPRPLLRTVHKASG